MINYCEGARELLAGTPDEEVLADIRVALDEAVEQALRAGQIVRRLRDFITYGHTERKVEYLPRVVTEANALALVGSREYDIEVDVRLDASAQKVLIDRIQIQQVLLNLIRNAIDAMIDSLVRVLTISSEPEGDGMVRLSVADTGNGLSEEVAAQLFQPFITTKERGMGIGLSICRTIVEAHGGRIWCEHRAMGGTIFHFTIPEAGSAND